MKVGILTAPRPAGAEYLRGTIDNVLHKDTGASHTVRVFVDALELPSLRTEHERVSYELASVEQRRRVEEGMVFGTLNFCKALRWSCEDDEFACVFEDDVELSRQWSAKALALCADASRLTKSYVMSLHHFYQMSDFSVCAVANNVQLMRWRDPRGFYGGQGLIMPRHCALIMAETLEKCMALPRAERGPCCMDMGVKKVVVDNRWAMYSPNPCLLQHVGDTSSVISGRPPIRNIFFSG